MIENLEYKQVAINSYSWLDVNYKLFHLYSLVVPLHAMSTTGRFL